MSKIKSYVVSIAISLGTGLVSAFLTRESMDIYSSISTPPLSPPAILFPIVWTILFILMGISAAMVNNSRENEPAQKKKALTTYGASLFVNFTWSLIFFNLKAFSVAFIWLIVLLILIVKTISEYSKINKVAAYLQIPYALWVTFAGYLNLGIVILN